MFKHNLKKWRPGWSEKILITIQPTSENSILLKNSERRIELCCENKNHILMKRFVSKLFFYDYDQQHDGGVKNWDLILFVILFFQKFKKKMEL